jgi:TetR/AcrR family transcriptional regulator
LLPIKSGRNNTVRLGRPRNQSDVRGKLLRAGRALYQERGLERVSLREVADRAGVNQAMIRYYFKDKLGFEQAMLDDGFDNLLASIREGEGLTVVLQSFISTLNKMPWLPLLMVRTVYLSDTLRTYFIKKHAPRILAAIRSEVSPRPGLESRYLFASIIAMVVFPQLARPVMGPVLGIQFNEPFAAAFATHISKLVEERE